jgi:hypothetical protein
MCLGDDSSLTKTNKTDSVLLANLFLLLQEFKLDFIELIYCYFYLLGREHIT